MEYEGLTRDDLENVHALNSAWLVIAGADLDEHGLSARRRRQLATTPFLLFTMREHDADWWEWLLDDARQEDLLAVAQAPSRRVHSLQAMALAFLWDLSRRNPYVARLVSGAPLRWCERIASVTLARTLECAGHCSFVEPRLLRGSPAYTHLLRRGGSSMRAQRIFAQIVALQAMLTGTNGERYERMPAAACRMAVPSREVADDL